MPCCHYGTCSNAVTVLSSAPSSYPESAGVLIGERRGQHLVVCDISEPGSGDIRQRCRVDRRGVHHQSRVNEAFERSAGTHLYLGEWHTPGR